MNKLEIQEYDQTELQLVDKIEQLKSRLDQLAEKLNRSGQLKKLIEKLPD